VRADTESLAETGMAPYAKLPTHVRLVEVGPRDGLQNESALVPAATKVALIDELTAAGFAAIEATAFVSPKWVPQMADAAEVMARIRRREGVRYPVLTPNLKGFEAALAANADEVAVFVAASEAFSQRNINCTIAESLERARPVFAAAKTHGIRVRGYISCVLGCPYEGEIDPRKVADVASALYVLGAYEVSLGDTIGVGTAGKTKALIATVAAQVPLAALAGHFHDTYGQALTNVYAALEMGVATFDASVAGLGGCPYAKGATGNVASEDLLYLLNGLGIETGVDMRRLRIAGEFISGFLGRPPVSRVARALAAKDPLPAGDIAHAAPSGTRGEGRLT
jgi:isopropylmalate/homocitrate/citramalate synthase